MKVFLELVILFILVSLASCSIKTNYKNRALSLAKCLCSQSSQELEYVIPSNQILEKWLIFDYKCKGSGHGYNIPADGYYNGCENL